jgi:hypothetical protein
MSRRFENDDSPNEPTKNILMQTRIVLWEKLLEIVLPHQVNIKNNGSNTASTSTTTEGSSQVPSLY